MKNTRKGFLQWSGGALEYPSNISTQPIRYYYLLMDVIRSSADAPDVVEKVAREFKIKAKVCFNLS